MLSQINRHQLRVMSHSTAVSQQGFSCKAIPSTTLSEHRLLARIRALVDFGDSLAKHCNTLTSEILPKRQLLPGASCSKLPLLSRGHLLAY